MVDTFVFRILNLDQYPMLLHYARSNSGKEWFQTKSDKKSEKMEVRRWMLDYSKDVSIPLRYTDKRNIPSSNHDIPYTIDWNKNHLEVNVSVPKMLFGNNVCETVIPPGAKMFSVSNTSPYQHVDFIYDLLKETVVKVCFALSDGNYVETGGSFWCDVEVVRVDMCVNQQFANKTEALRWHQHQQQLKKKYNRLEGTSNTASWKTSLTFKTERYYAKIYHKGTEFEQIQSKKIIKINELRRKQGLPLLSSSIDYANDEIKQLQAYADRILRYELEFKKAYLSYIYNYKINKRWSAQWTDCVKLFTFFKKHDHLRMGIFSFKRKYMDHNGDVHETKPYTHNIRKVLYYHQIWNAEAQRHIEVPFERKEVLRLRQLLQIGINDKVKLDAWMNRMEKELNRTRTFTFAVPKTQIDTTLSQHRDERGILHEIDPFNTETPTNVRFTKSLLDEMVNSLKSFFDNFQIATKRPMAEFQDKLDKWNEEVVTRLSNAVSPKDKKLVEKDRITQTMYRKMMEFHRLIGKDLKETDLVPKYYSRATFYRMRTLYKKIDGRKEQIAHVHFSQFIQTNFHQIYENLLRDITTENFLSKFYNSAFAPIGRIKTAV